MGKESGQPTPKPHPRARPQLIASIDPAVKNAVEAYAADRRIPVSRALDALLSSALGLGAHEAAT